MHNVFTHRFSNTTNQPHATLGSVASWRRVGVTWDDVHALVLQLAHCAGTVARDVAAEMHDLWSQL